MSWTLPLALVIGLGLAFPAGSTARAGTVGNSDADRGGDDETIGTLPILGNEGQLALVRRVRDAHPGFYLEGSYGEILSTIVGFRGTGSVTSEALPGGLVRLGFHGQLELALDRGLLQITGIQIGAGVPAAFGEALAWAGFPGEVESTHVLQPGDLALPVTALDALGSLDQTPWILAARSGAPANYRFHAIADAGLLYIGQTY